jgi:hypothetical protein
MPQFVSSLYDNSKRKLDTHAFPAKQSLINIMPFRSHPAIVGDTDCSITLTIRKILNLINVDNIKRRS